MKDRLSKIIREEGLSALRFAEMMEVQPSSISHLLSGRNKPSFDFLEKILNRFPHINPDWLIMGKGEMHRTQTPAVEALSVEETDLFTNVMQDKVDLQNATPVMIVDKEPAEALLLEDETDNTLAKRMNAADYRSKQTENHLKITDVNITNSNPKELERIIFFYKDKSFEEYKPE